MARVTIQDSLKNVDNHFQLIHVASRRARQLEHGAKPLVDPGHDNHCVVALREIAAGFIAEQFDKSFEEGVIARELENQ